jgi:4-hydroxybenzoate polyprenyltransferase
MIKKLLKIARIDHWGKNSFVIPGMILAIFFVKKDVELFKLVLAILATCFISSANYIINEYLDREFDKYHPTKKNRTLVMQEIKFRYILLDYIFFAGLGLVSSFIVSKYVFVMEICLLFMGIIYNVKPIRSKDIPIIDVLSESINNIIRLLIGWFSITIEYVPPSSIILAYWMFGAFLMTVKRFSEYRTIQDKNIAELYRKSFKYYTEQKLLLIAVFYAMLALFFCGIFIVKYKVELVISIPFIAAIFCYYLKLGYKDDSPCAKPEKLYKEKMLMIFVALLVIMIIILLNIKIPALEIFLSNDLIKIK